MIAFMQSLRDPNAVMEGKAPTPLRRWFTRLLKEPAPTACRLHAPISAADQAALCRVTPWDNYYRTAAENNGIPWQLLKAISFYESSFDPNALAHSKYGTAYGLMQILNPPWYERANIYNPQFNVNKGAAILAQKIREEGGNITLALAAYNGALSHGRITPNGAKYIDVINSYWAHITQCQTA